MKNHLTLILLAILLATGCCRTNGTVSLPRAQESAQWAAAVESFICDAAGVTAPDFAQPLRIMALDHGKVVFDRCYGGKTPESMLSVYSISKTVLALAVGIAVDEGLFSVEDRVIDFFPDALPEYVSDTLSTMTVRHLLTMTCGLEETPRLIGIFSNGEKDFDWIREFFASRLRHMPGTQFYYNFFASYIVAAILEKTSGTSVMDYIRPRLLEPLHITDMEWENSPQGICVGGWGMLLCAEDVAKLGQLLLQRGRWNGRRIVSAQWVDTMTSKLVESAPLNAYTIRKYSPEELSDPENEHSQGYGYFVWQGKYGTFRMEGMTGNFAIVSPEKETVLVILSHANMDQEYINLIWKNFSSLM